MGNTVLGGGGGGKALCLVKDGECGLSLKREDLGMDDVARRGDRCPTLSK